jgi:hypothetical protein
MVLMSESNGNDVRKHQVCDNAVVLHDITVLLPWCYSDAVPNKLERLRRSIKCVTTAMCCSGRAAHQCSNLVLQWCYG